MRYLLLAFGLLAAPVGVFALTWDFDEDTTWGWAAQESIGPSVRVICLQRRRCAAKWPTACGASHRHEALGCLPLNCSRRLSAKTRRCSTGSPCGCVLIYHSPTEGAIQMWWFNSERKRHYGKERPVGMSFASFVEGFFSVFTTDWQELTIALDREGLVWQDSLFYFELSLALNRRAEGPEDFPDLEVDWIQLTGAEELLLGELEPRAVASGRGRPARCWRPLFFRPCGGALVSWDSGLLVWRVGRCGRRWGCGSGDVDEGLSPKRPVG